MQAGDPQHHLWLTFQEPSERNNGCHSREFRNSLSGQLTSNARDTHVVGPANVPVYMNLFESPLRSNRFLSSDRKITIHLSKSYAEWHEYGIAIAIATRLGTLWTARRMDHPLLATVLRINISRIFYIFPRFFLSCRMMAVFWDQFLLTLSGWVT